MNRQNLKFEYTCRILLSFVQSKIDHEEERLVFWGGEYDQAKKLLKEAGAQFREQPITGGTRVEIVIDPLLQRRFDECATKVKEHENKLKQYERWKRVFRSNISETVELDMDDIEFFGM